MAASIIDVVASGHINRSVILDVTERLAIQTPRYWVAQATLAVAAWLDDNPQQHREALDYALALDYEKTSLFMALLLRDQDRDEALQEWLAAYLSRLTPVNLPRHFQVVIDAATGKALGDGAAPRLVKQVGEWYARGESPARTSSTPRSASGSGGCSAWARGTASSRTSRCSPPTRRHGRCCLPGTRPAGPSSRPPGTSVSASRRARTCRMTSGGTSPSCSTSWPAPRTPRRRNSSA